MINKMWWLVALMVVSILVVSGMLLPLESGSKTERDWAKAEAGFKAKIFKDTIEIKQIGADLFKDHQFYQITARVPQVVFGQQKEINRTISLGTFALKIDGTAKELRQLEDITAIAKEERLKLTKDDDVKSLVLICDKLVTKIRLSNPGIYHYEDQQGPERTVKDIKKDSKSYYAKSVVYVEEELYGLKFVTELAYQYEFKLNDNGELKDIIHEEKSEWESLLRFMGKQD